MKESTASYNNIKQILMMIKLQFYLKILINAKFI